MHGTEQMMEDHHRMQARVDELEGKNQELDRSFMALTDAYASLYAVLIDLEHAVLNVRADISKDALEAIPELTRAGLDLALAHARRLLGTPEPQPSAYPVCHKSEFCARREGHEGECDDIPF